MTNPGHLPLLERCGHCRHPGWAHPAPDDEDGAVCIGQGCGCPVRQLPPKRRKTTGPCPD